eukprot:gene32664-43653_t
MTEQRCNSSTKEELRADGCKNAGDCPVCLRHENFHWAVGDHRSAEPVQPGLHRWFQCLFDWSFLTSPANTRTIENIQRGAFSDIEFMQFLETIQKPQGVIKNASKWSLQGNVSWIGGVKEMYVRD